jgi:hypothetical protein
MNVVRGAARSVGFLTVAFGVLGCGGSSQGSMGSPYTVDEVKARFADVTGATLRSINKGGVLDLRRFGGVRSVGLTDRALRQEYGEFLYVVVLDEPTSEVGRNVDPSRPSPGEKPDSNGVYWQQQFPERGADTRPYWVASVYRGNVKLLWWPPSRQKGSTEAFLELKRVLDSLRGR